MMKSLLLKGKSADATGSPIPQAPHSEQERLAELLKENIQVKQVKQSRIMLRLAGYRIADAVWKRLCNVNCSWHHDTTAYLEQAAFLS